MDALQATAIFMGGLAVGISLTNLIWVIFNNRRK